MIKTIFASSFLASLFLIIQTTWLRNGLLLGVIPDFALLVIIWVAYSNKDSQGAVSGFLAGIVCGLLSSSPLGYFSFLYVVPAYVTSLVSRFVIMDGLFIPFLMGFFATVLKGLASIFLAVLFGSGYVNAYSLSDFHFWIEAALNGVAAPLLFLAFGRLRGFLITKKVTG